MLTDLDLKELTAFRRALHRRPELSGEEAQTARSIAAALRDLLSQNVSPAHVISNVVTGLGGHGVAAVFDSGRAGPTVMFRAELDGLPIAERTDVAWASQNPGKSHACGHDGHMSMLLALGRMIARNPVARGRVVLMFQPAEEDGSGARAVMNDPAFRDILPDWAFAIHLQPGQPLGYASSGPGLINCASLGLKITLTGKTAHAANPEDGQSPSLAIAGLIPALDALAKGGALDDAFTLLTITHGNIGAPTFGIAPGQGEIYATLRAAQNESLAALHAGARDLVQETAQEFGLGVAFEVCDEFAASINDPQAYGIAAAAMDAIGVPHGNAGVPMRASEDFGVFGAHAKAAMIWLGAGKTHPALHNPDYDFPDELIPVGAAIFERIARDILGSA